MRAAIFNRRDIFPAPPFSTAVNSGVSSACSPRITAASVKIAALTSSDVRSRSAAKVVVMLFMQCLSWDVGSR